MVANLRSRSTPGGLAIRCELSFLRRRPRSIGLESPMKIVSKWLTFAGSLAILLIFDQSAFARGGAPNIMNSPGYQRRLQESRQQPSQADLQTPAVRRKARHWHWRH